jgi:hypothetical protein
MVSGLINGKRVLGIWKSKKSIVGLADYEMPPDELKERYMTVIGDHPGFFIASFVGDDLDDPRHIEELEYNINELGLDVLIIDPLSAAFDASFENSPTAGRVMRGVRALARRNHCAIIVVHHTGIPRYDEEGNQLPLTPRGHSSIRQPVDVELQIVPTRIENRTTLLCTKSRRAKSIVRPEWRRDFVFDPDAFRLTPLHEYDEDKEELLRRFRAVARSLNLSGRALANEFDVSERQIRRYLAGENYPDDAHLLMFVDALSRLEDEASRA